VISLELRANERPQALLESVMAILRQSCNRSGKMALQAGLWSSMSQNRFKKTALCATAGIALLIALSGLLFVVEQRRTQAEMSAVLSAFFSQDMDKWDAGRTITIVVMRNPDCRICTEPTGCPAYRFHTWGF
jgi:hypothetical protein